MKEEKNLDRLFQEKFKDFEQHPSDTVWKNIVAAQKEEKDERKLSPLWWKLGGVAALVALLFTAGLTFFSDSSSDPLENNSISVKENTTQTETPTEKAATKGTLSTSSEKVAQQDRENNSNTNNATATAVSTVTAPAANNRESAQNTLAQTNTSTFPKSNNKRKRVTSQEKNSPQQNPSITSTSTKTNKQSPLKVKKNRAEVLQEQTGTTVATAVQNKEESNDIKNTTQTLPDEKRSLVDEAKLINEEKEDIALAENAKNKKRWDIGAVAAPVYYGDFGGSGIDPAFSDNAKSGDVNFSYGVQISYNLSPKIKVRAGVNNVDLSYNTNDIAFAAAPGARRLSGINYNENARALNIADAGSARLATLAQDNLFGEGANNVNITNGSLQQRIGFVEIPVEGVYVVSDKRLGIQLVGGISTLLLNNNEVILNAEDGLQSNLGSANGVNDVSFTTNVGLGLDYKMTDKIKFNMEPSLKYQLNAFDESVGDFKPYFIGLYTGVSYRF